mgnify:CR=1 FL=1
MPRLLAVDAGVRTGLAAFDGRGLLLWCRSRNFGTVSRLRRAGAIVLGKTTTSEFVWKGVSQSPLTGITHNP